MMREGNKGAQDEQSRRFPRLQRDREEESVSEAGRLGYPPSAGSEPPHHRVYCSLSAAAYHEKKSDACLVQKLFTSRDDDVR